jgi:hypothetical protein
MSYFVVRPLRRRVESKTRKLMLTIALIGVQLISAFAWVFPEHRDIAVLSVQRLDAEQQSALQKLWSEARSGHEARLCEQVADTAQAVKPTCIDYAAWTAIAGDHSCSAGDMLNTVLNAPWILGVAGVSAKLKTQLAAAERRDQRVNAVRASDLALQRTDPEYVTRASSNNAHFMLARPDVAMEPKTYGVFALGPKADLNSIATYVWYHLRAVAKAAHLARGGVTSQGGRAQGVLAILADEAFALHFLEDSFAAGHVTGTWGNTAVRLGTHDYYNQHGISAVSWNAKHFVALGDANMRPEDAERAALALRDSLAQLLDAFAGKFEVGASADITDIAPEGFDVCHQPHFPALAGSSADLQRLIPVVEQTPVPALAAGLGELPRFRAELGPFIGLSTAVRGGALGGGFGSTQSGVSATGGLDAAVRLGVGLEGVLNESSDGQAFVEFGIRQDPATNGSFRIPGRGALTARFRAPYWLIPGDLILAGPILAFTSPQKLQKMAVQAANGGLIPWQAGIATRIGRFQFVLGREVGLSFYRHGDDHPFLIPTPGVPPLDVTAVAVTSMQVEFPILDYRLFRTFSLNQSSALTIQPYVGFDTPTGSSVVSPSGAAPPHLQTIITGGVRVVFDWRHYVDKSSSAKP